MSRYTDAVARGLEGLEAVSTGLCPGCAECRGEFADYRPREDYASDAEDAPLVWTVPALEGESFESEEAAEVAAREAFDEDVRNGSAHADPFFSWEGCDICGSSLGGDFEPWHAIMKPRKEGERGELFHGSHACVDCVVFLANGDEPENWGDEDEGEEEESDAERASREGQPFGSSY